MSTRSLPECGTSVSTSGRAALSAGLTARLDYLHGLGVQALWISPVLKNPRPDWQYNYHGYGAQDFLELDGRLAADGTRAGAERELSDLVEQAHGRGIAVILDVVLNHAGRVFDYVRDGQTVKSFVDRATLDGALGTEPPVRWLNGFGFPRADWQDVIPGGQALSADDAVYPEELRRQVFFADADRRSPTIPEVRASSEETSTSSANSWWSTTLTPPARRRCGPHSVGRRS